MDLNLPDGDGIEVFRLARESDPERDGIVITGQASLDSAVEEGLAFAAGVAAAVGGAGVRGDGPGAAGNCEMTSGWQRPMRVKEGERGV